MLFPLLAGNMDLSQESLDKTARLASHPNLYDYDNDTQTAKYILKPLQDKQVAIVGITLDQMKEIARPDEDTHFINAIETNAEPSVTGEAGRRTVELITGIYRSSHENLPVKFPLSAEPGFDGRQ